MTLHRAHVQCGWLCLMSGMAFGAASWSRGEPMSTTADTTPRYQPLPKRAVGMFVGDVQPLLDAEGRTGPADAIGFGRDQASYRWVYLPAIAGEKDNDTLTLRVGEDGKAMKEFTNIVMADAAALKRRRVPTPYALVEVEVNGDLGSPAEEAFVATQVKVLDGTPAYPLRTAEVLRDLRDQYRTYLNGQKQVVQKEMEKAAKAALKDQQPTGPREEDQTVAVTWLSKTERLRAEFRSTFTDGAYQRGQGAKGLQKGTGPRHGTQFGVTLGVAYEVDKAGKLVTSQSLSLKSFVKNLPPPPELRGVPLPVKKPLR